MYPPNLDAVGGRSYSQSSQTAGALGGRRDSVQYYRKWIVPHLADPDYWPAVRVAGGSWRVIVFKARIPLAAPDHTFSFFVGLQLPSRPGFQENLHLSSALEPIISPGQLESVDGILDPRFKIIPIGTLVTLFAYITGPSAPDQIIELSAELHYRTHAVSQ